MTIKALSDSDIWKEFETEAKKHRRNPVRLLSDYMRECLEIWEHENLDDEISKEAQKSGYTEDDAVRLVKQYRREKKENAAA